MVAGTAGARFIDRAGGHVSRIRFDAAGRLVDYGFDRQLLAMIIQTGKPFQASGCSGRQDDVPACNRPYGDSMPATSAFPFAPDVRDVGRVRRQMRGGDICTEDICT